MEGFPKKGAADLGVDWTEKNKGFWVVAMGFFVGAEGDGEGR